ncbi:hypothetical protein SEEAA707_20512, partial [Salmonella enterica subsp. enterica serovar Agona str. ATCC BAA-707]
LPSRILSPLSTVSHISPYGKDEKLRLRFDSSESEKALPQATTRRAKRAALSHPSPTTIMIFRKHLTFIRHRFVIILPMWGRMRSFD